MINWLKSLFSTAVEEAEVEPKRKKRVVLSDTDRDSVRLHIKQGLPKEDVARYFNISLPTIYRILNEEA